MDTLPLPLPTGMDLKMYNELVGPDKVPFFNLLLRLTFSSGTERIDAETHFKFVGLHNPNKISMKLISIIRSSVHSDIRITAVNWLRSVLGRYPRCYLWLRLEPRIQNHIKDSLLNFVDIEETRSVLEQLRKAVVELGANLLPDNSWLALVNFMFYAMFSPSPWVKESGLFIFSHLAGFIRRSLNLPLNNIRSIIECYLILGKLNGEDVPDVRNAALLAATTLIHIIPPPKYCEKLQNLLPVMIHVLLQAFIANQQEFVQEAVKRLNYVIVVEPKFIFPCLPEVVEGMLHIAECDEIKEELRFDAVNLVVTLAKAREKEPVMVEQHLVPFLGRIVAILLQMLSDVEDDEAWYTAYQNDEENNIKYAKMFSNTLSAALGGDFLVPEVIKLLLVHLADSDWKKRHAALFFLNEIAEGCFEALRENLEQFVSMMVASFKDIHQRVQEAALIAIRVLLVDLKPDLEAQYHDRIFPALLQAMNTFDCPGVQVEAARSAWNFMCSCSKDISKIYLNDILDKLYMMILTGNMVVQDEALLILGSLAYLLEDILESLYEDVMRWLKAFLKDAISNANRMFCAKLMQCISIVGTVLGKGHFRNDAKEVMKELMSFKGALIEADDPATGCLLEAWMKLLKCLGRDFLPYMTLVMPPLLQSAQSDLELIVSSTNLDNTEVKTGKGAGEKLLDEKASACNMLCCYADELKEDFYPWIDQVASLLLPFLKIMFHKKVREAAISAMSKLLRSTKLAVEKGIPDGPEAPRVEVKKLCAKIIPSLIDAMHEEHDIELCCEMVKSLVNCIQLSKS